MNRTSTVFSRPLYIHFRPPLGKCPNNFCINININIFSYLVGNETAKIYSNSLYSKKKANRKTGILFFAVHITGIILIYAFRAIPLTQSKLQLIMIALKRSFSFCQLIQTRKVEHWIRVYSCQSWGRLQYSFTHLQLHFFLIQLTGVVNRLSWNNVLICVHWHKSRSETFQKLKFSSKF